jgi:hypothetical protein
MLDYCLFYQALVAVRANVFETTSLLCKPSAEISENLHAQQ